MVSKSIICVQQLFSHVFMKSLIRMKELAEVKSSVLQLHKGAEKRLEAFIQVARQCLLLWICVCFSKIFECEMSWFDALLFESDRCICVFILLLWVFDVLFTIVAGRAQRMGSNVGQSKP